VGRITLARLRALIKLLLPTFGKPTTPTVTEIAELGRYALMRRMSAGAVGEFWFVRDDPVGARKGRVGVECLR
jgi:hypothetical protein